MPVTVSIGRTTTNMQVRITAATPASRPHHKSRGVTRPTTYLVRVRYKTALPNGCDPPTTRARYKALGTNRHQTRSVNAYAAHQRGPLRQGAAHQARLHSRRHRRRIRAGGLQQLQTSGIGQCRQNGRRHRRCRGGPAAQRAHRHRHLDSPADRDRPGWVDRAHAGLRQHHPGTADPGQGRRRACGHGLKPARSSDFRALARHRAAQRHGRRRARHPEHRRRRRLHLSVLRPECRHLLGPPARRPRRRHGALSAGHRRRSDRAGQLRRRMDCRH